MQFTKPLLWGMLAFLVTATLVCGSATAISIEKVEVPSWETTVPGFYVGCETRTYLNVTDQAAYLLTFTNGESDGASNTATITVNGRLPYYKDSGIAFGLYGYGGEEGNLSDNFFVAKIYLSGLNPDNYIEIVDELGNDFSPAYEGGLVSFYYAGNGTPVSIYYSSDDEPDFVIDFDLTNATKELSDSLSLVSVNNTWIDPRDLDVFYYGHDDEFIIEPVVPSLVFRPDIVDKITQPISTSSVYDEETNTWTVKVLGTIPYYSQNPFLEDFWDYEEWSDMGKTHGLALQFVIRNFNYGSTIITPDEGNIIRSRGSMDVLIYENGDGHDTGYIYVTYAFGPEDFGEDLECVYTLTFSDSVPEFEPIPEEDEPESNGDEESSDELTPLTVKVDFSGASFAELPRPTLKKVTTDFYRPDWALEGFNQSNLYLLDGLGFREDDGNYLIVLNGMIPSYRYDPTDAAYGAADWRWGMNVADDGNLPTFNIFGLKFWVDNVSDPLFEDVERNTYNIYENARFKTSQIPEQYTSVGSLDSSLPLYSVISGYGRDSIRTFYYSSSVFADPQMTQSVWGDRYTYNGNTVPAIKLTLDNSNGADPRYIYIINSATLENKTRLTSTSINVTFGGRTVGGYGNFFGGMSADAYYPGAVAMFAFYDKNGTLVGSDWLNPLGLDVALTVGETYTYVVRYNRGLDKVLSDGETPKPGDDEWVYGYGSYTHGEALDIDLKSKVRFFNVFGKPIDPTYDSVGLGNDKISLNHSTIEIYDKSGKILVATRDTGNGSGTADAGSLSLNLMEGEYKYKIYRDVPGEYVLTVNNIISSAIGTANLPRVGYLPTGMKSLTVDDSLMTDPINETLDIGFEYSFFVYDRSAANSGPHANGVSDFAAILLSGISGATITVTNTADNSVYTADERYLVDTSLLSLPAAIPATGLYSVFLPFGDYTYTVSADGYGSIGKTGSFSVSDKGLVEINPAGQSFENVSAKFIGLTANDFGFSVYDSDGYALNDATVELWTRNLNKADDAPIAIGRTGQSDLNGLNRGWYEFGTYYTGGVIPDTFVLPDNSMISMNTVIAPVAWADDNGMINLSIGGGITLPINSTLDIRDVRSLFYIYHVLTAKPYFTSEDDRDKYNASVTYVTDILVNYYGIPATYAQQIEANACYDARDQTADLVAPLPFSSFDEFVTFVDYFLAKKYSINGYTTIIGKTYLPNDLENGYQWTVNKDKFGIRTESDEIYKGRKFTVDGQTSVTVPLTESFPVVICVYELLNGAEMPLSSATFQSESGSAIPSEIGAAPH